MYGVTCDIIAGKREGSVYAIWRAKGSSVGLRSTQKQLWMALLALCSENRKHTLLTMLLSGAACAATAGPPLAGRFVFWPAGTAAVAGRLGGAAPSGAC